MKTLQENYQVFVLLCVCPSDKPISRRMKIFYISISALCATVVFTALISSSVYFLKNYSIDLEGAIFAVAQIVAAFVISSTLIIAHFKRHDIKKIFNDIQSHYDACKYRTKFSFSYLKINYLLKI